MKKVDKQVVFITGASGGFGQLLCHSFYHAGYYVIATLRDMAKKPMLLEKVNIQDENNGRFHLYKMDVTDEQQISHVVGEVIKDFGHIDVLINNAGFASGGFIEEISLETWREQFDTNVFGVISVTKAILPYMREARSGTIINMSSISGRFAFPGLGPYSTSKYAIEGYSESLRFEMKPYGIRVMLVEPGSYKTHIWSKGLTAFRTTPSSPYSAQTEHLMHMVKAIEKHAGDPNDVAQYILRIIEKNSKKFRHPIGKGVKNTLRLKHLVPWHWIENSVVKRLK